MATFWCWQMVLKMLENSAENTSGPCDVTWGPDWCFYDGPLPRHWLGQSESRHSVLPDDYSLEIQWTTLNKNRKTCMLFRDPIFFCFLFFSWWSWCLMQIGRSVALFWVPSWNGDVRSYPSLTPSTMVSLQEMSCWAVSCPKRGAYVWFSGFVLLFSKNGPDLFSDREHPRAWSHGFLFFPFGILPPGILMDFFLMISAGKVGPSLPKFWSLNDTTWCQDDQEVKPANSPRQPLWLWFNDQGIYRDISKQRQIPFGSKTSAWTAAANIIQIFFGRSKDAFLLA